jgi:Tfp pilus assembly protein PilE
MRRYRTHAFTIIEVTAAAAILAVLLAAFVPATLLVQNHRRESAAHCLALQAADNLLEHVLALPWGEIHSDVAGDTVRAEQVLAGVPGASWRIIVADESSNVSAKRVTVQVSYGAGVRADVVEFTAWVYQDARNIEES